MPHTACSETPSWNKLNLLAKNQLVLNQLFQENPHRFSEFSYQAPSLLADLSKQHITNEICAALVELARQCQLEEKRDAMFSGQVINITENRQVLHTSLRGISTSPNYSEVEATCKQFLQYAETIRTNPEITDIVNIGIGGSDLGPQLGLQALAPYVKTGKRFHFVSNVDGFELARILTDLQPQNTLFIIVSKSFSTQETLLNAQCAKAWFLSLGYQNIADHFIGITTNIQAAKEFGIQKTFTFWDWVGGRFSVWSAVGLSLAIAIGSENFLAFLEGARQMDRHFKNTPLEENVPALLGLQDIWNRNFLQRQSRCVAPYYQSLAGFPRYLQQLEMESNGKSVTFTGNPVSYGTSPVIFGETGTNCQHAFFQMLHQGTDVIPVDFILVKTPTYSNIQLAPAVLKQITEQHRTLLMNALAQSRALMVGQSLNQEGQQDFLAPHRYFPGNRPSTTIVLEKLDPMSLGSLIALHEHRIFTCGAIWDIDSFDQWGVELGKNIAKELLNKKDDTLSSDASTSGLLRYLNTN